MKEPIALALKLDERKLPAQVFDKLSSRSMVRREWARREEEAWQNFGKPGRDPGRLGGVMAAMARQGDWVPHLKIAQLRNHWDQVVGAGIARHSEVTSLADGVLTIRAESTVWATQLTYLIPQLKKTIRQRLEGLDVREIHVTGPQSHRFNRYTGGARRYPRRG
ncbi:DUF721 domain-containing protein [Bifidobacterium sp. ESL0763]|uniref:DUF721 domain-containing protein n=1 Tax=Bifidobacterium sp. ESL0763 TaxID=2983227 RepID=UPI0023F7FFC6|nr:DUF721 domain-containing protein [Bifidobacterium sp. ESL0763]MDF7663133.1 DUF721 domain-containing protein [Bifidobacterium sp. ESL0763]